MNMTTSIDPNSPSAPLRVRSVLRILAKPAVLEIGQIFGTPLGFTLQPMLKFCPLLVLSYTERDNFAHVFLMKSSFSVSF